MAQVWPVALSWNRSLIQEGRGTLHQNRNRCERRHSERNKNLKTRIGVGVGSWGGGGGSSPCDRLVYKTLLQSVGKALVNQRVADEGPSLAEGRLQLGVQKKTHISTHTRRRGDETSSHSECQLLRFSLMRACKSRLSELFSRWEGGGRGGGILLRKRQHRSNMSTPAGGLYVTNWQTRHKEGNSNIISESCQAFRLLYY